MGLLIEITFASLTCELLKKFTNIINCYNEIEFVLLYFKVHNLVN
jgi:hypothetical protein